MQAALRMVRERSTLEALGFQLSDHRFDVVEAAYFLRHVDRGSRGVNLLQASVRHALDDRSAALRSEEHTSELQSLMRITYAVFGLNKKKKTERERNRMHRN